MASDDGDIKIDPEEVLHGIGFKAYSEEILQLVDLVFESSGVLLNQDQVMDFDPDFLTDFARYRKYKRAMKKDPNNKRDSGK